MGSKSPVDELVDGIDAIGTILDENLPQIKSRLDELLNDQIENTTHVNLLHQSSKTVDENMVELRKAATNSDIRQEEVLNSIAALGRRLDQLQKSILDLTVQVEELSIDNELVDAVKMLEDRVRKVELDPSKPDGNDLGKRF
ncbi:MAG: hypothetical protein GY841_08025 [FCB group bacterium]|nr:hypothetical protein [FCB group bacterium]